MAIIRKDKAVAFDDTPEESTGETDEMPSKPMETGLEEATEPSEDSETTTIGLDMLGGQKVAPGDVVKLEVVSVSPEDGTAVLKYATPKTGGIAKAAAAFNEGP